MKKHILSLVSVAIPISWAGAMLPQEVSVSSDLTFASEYVFRGIEVADNSFQPTLEVGLGDFYAGLWGNLPADAGASELNYYGGIGFDVPGVDFATFDVGVTVYHYPNQSARRTHEFYAGLLLPLVDMPGLTAGLYYFYDADIKSHVGEGSVTYSHSLEGTGLPASLDFTVLGGVQGGTEMKGSENYNYYGASVVMPISLTEFSAITAGVHFATAEKYDFASRGGRGKNLFWTLGYSTSF